ncbi:MAG TPA: hypothetical protein VIA18_08745 [Polyangia bacterium]|nr:hypothetical protein [Polyangia bacterium]
MRKLVLVVACAVFVAGCLDSIIPAHTSSTPAEKDMSQPAGNTSGGDMDMSTADGG